MEFFVIILALAFHVYISIKIADWGEKLGLRWGVIFVWGVLVSPLISILPVLFQWTRGKKRFNFS